MINKKTQRLKRHFRIRKKLAGTQKVPRLVVFRSNKHIYAQIINDVSGQTIVSSSDNKLAKEKTSKLEMAKKVGINLANAALKKNIKGVVFDRAGYKYHGRVKALAEGSREGGLSF